MTDLIKAALEQADFFLSHSGNQRAIVGNSFEKPSGRWDEFQKTKSMVKAALKLSGAGSTDVCRVSSVEAQEILANPTATKEQIEWAHQQTKTLSGAGSPEETKPRDWIAVVNEANHIRKVLDDKPSAMKIGHWPSAGSILNAYREGDLTFNEAVEQLNKWAASSLSERRADRARR